MRSRRRADDTLQVWDLKSRPKPPCSKATESGDKVAIAPDGRRAVSASLDKTLRVWDLESGQSIRTLEGHSRRVTGVAIRRTDAVRSGRPRGRHAAGLGPGERPKPPHARRPQQSGDRVAITPDGRRAVTASEDNTLRVWDLESGQSLFTLEGRYAVSTVAVPIGAELCRAGSGTLIEYLQSGQSLHASKAIVALGQCRGGHAR